MNKQESIEFATKYLEDLLTFFGSNLTVEASCSDDVIELSVPADDSSSILIGRGAETLRSIQYLVSTTLRNNNAELTRVNVDIADYKKKRAEKLVEKARGWIEKVIETGEDHASNLNAADRRIVHHLVGEYEEVETYSTGEGRDRKIVITKK